MNKLFIENYNKLEKKIQQIEILKKHDEEREKKDKEYKEELEEIIRRNVQYIKTPDKSKRANRGRKNRRTRILI